jgi:hypothetical protein
MDEFSPVTVGTGSSTGRNRGEMAWGMAITSNVHHWPNPFDRGEAVDTGKGSRLEHFIPEQGLCCPGARWSAGI